MTQNFSCRRYNNGSIYEQVTRNHLNPIGRSRNNALGGDGSSYRQLNEKGPYRTQASSQDYLSSSPYSLEDVFRTKQRTLGSGFSRQVPISFPPLQEQRRMNVSPSEKVGCTSSSRPDSLPRFSPEPGQSPNSYLTSASQSGLITASQRAVDLRAASSCSSSQPSLSFDNVPVAVSSRGLADNTRSHLHSLSPVRAPAVLPHLLPHELNRSHEDSSMDASTCSTSNSGSIPSTNSAPNRSYPLVRTAEREKRSELSPNFSGRSFSRRDLGSPNLRFGPKDPSLTPKVPFSGKLEKMQVSGSPPRMDSLSSSEILKLHSTESEMSLDQPNNADVTTPNLKEDKNMVSPRRKLLMPLTSINSTPVVEVYNSSPQNDLSAGLPQAPPQLQFLHSKPDHPGRRASYAIASIIGSPKLESVVKFTSNFPNIHYINRITTEEIPGILCTGSNFLCLAINPPPNWALAKSKNKKEDPIPLHEKVKPKPAFSAVVFSPKANKKK